MDYKQEIEKGEALFADGQIDQSEAILKSILKDHPENREVLNNLGVICHFRGNFGKAEGYLLKALSVKEDYQDALLNLVNLYQDTKRWKEAAVQLEKYIAINDQDPDLFNRLGGVYLEMGNTEKARAVLAKSLELNLDQEVVRDSLKALENKREASGIKFSEKPLNILFVQEAPCIRNYKMATALRSRGHRVSLAYTKARLSQMYKSLSDDVYNECIQLKSHPHLWDISKNYDIVHCHNEPDVLTVSALAGDTPVVHDAHDLISLRHPGNENVAFFEGIANRGAAGRVHPTHYQAEEAKRLYGFEGPTLIFHNYVSEADLPKRFLPKLSEQDGQVHIVYEGGTGRNNHRDFSSLFIELDSQGINIHIYPAHYNDELAHLFSEYDNIHYYQPVSPKRIMEEMTQYDFGIIPFNIEKGNKRFLDLSFANKLFEYLAAGLPVITSHLKAYINYFKKNPVGLTFQKAEDIIEAIPNLQRIAKTVDFNQQVYSFEREIGRMEGFYYKLLDDYRRSPDQAAFSGSPVAVAVDTPKPRAENTAEFYDNLYTKGGWNKEYFKHYTETSYYEVWKTVLDWIKACDNPHIVDVGCGPGQFAQMLFDNGFVNYRGIDFSRTAIQMAQSRNPEFAGAFTIDNAVTSTIYNEDYSVAVMLEFLEHVQDDLKIISNIAENTTIIFSVPSFPSASHVRWFDNLESVIARYENQIAIDATQEIKFPQSNNKIFLIKGIKK